MATYERDSVAARRLRAMYAGGKAGRGARIYTRFWAWAFKFGPVSRRWVTLRVPGRTTGLPRDYPIGLAQLNGEWFAVAMLGECSWTRNARAAHGRVQLGWRGFHEVRLVPVPPAVRGPILRAYLQQVPGGRPHVPIDLSADDQEYARVAVTRPIFRVTSDRPTPWQGNTSTG